MTILERARQYREQLRKGETEAAKALIGAFGTAHNRLQAQLAKVTEKVEAARSAGQEVSKAWLAQEKRYKELLQQIDAETKRLANLGTAVTTKAQSDAVKLATKQAADFAHAAIGTSWNRVPFEALEHLVGTLQDGSPLKELFDKLGENASAEIQDALKTAIIQGKNPRDTAKVMREAFGGNLSRSLTVARTEQLRSYRQASLDNYRANDDVVQGWIRIETLDDLTCTVCIMEHGKEYPTDEDFDTHPNCRGTMIPKVEGKDYGMQTGQEWFEKQPEDKQREILGPSKYEAWKSGDITLDSLVEHTQHEKWGGGIRERTLEQAKEFTKNPPPKPESEPPKSNTPLTYVKDGLTYERKEVVSTILNPKIGQLSIPPASKIDDSKYVYHAFDAHALASKVTQGVGFSLMQTNKIAAAEWAIVQARLKNGQGIIRIDKYVVAQAQYQHKTVLPSKLEVWSEGKWHKLVFKEKKTVDILKIDKEDSKKFKKISSAQEYLDRMAAARYRDFVQPGIGDTLHSAANEYKGSGYVHINRKLRHEEEGAVNHTVEALDKATVGAVEAIKVYRAMQVDTPIEGGMFRDKGFASSSLSPAVAKRFVRDKSELVEVLVPKGAPVIYIDGLGRLTGKYLANSGEKEILIARNTQYQFVGYVKHEGKNIKQVRIVHQ